MSSAPSTVSMSWTTTAQDELAVMTAADCDNVDPKTWHEQKVAAYISNNSTHLSNVTKARIR